MPKFKYKIIHQNERFKIDDMFDDWITASSLFEARKAIEKAYPESLGYRCMLLQDTTNETNW